MSKFMWRSAKMWNYKSSQLTLFLLCPGNTKTLKVYLHNITHIFRSQNLGTKWWHISFFIGFHNTNDHLISWWEGATGSSTVRGLSLQCKHWPSHTNPIRHFNTAWFPSCGSLVNVNIKVNIKHGMLQQRDSSRDISATKPGAITEHDTLFFV